MSNILVIDNDIHICETISSLVTRQNHNCYFAHTIKDGLDMLDKINFSLIFLDISLPDGNGLSCLPAIKSSFARPEVIVITGKGNMEGAEEAIENGVWSFLVKPSSIEQIDSAMNQALHFHGHKVNLATLTESTETFEVEKIIGASPKMKVCYDLAFDAAKSHASILIDGETGTGKELFAQLIHKNSCRKDNKLVVVDCASLTDSLVESTLFGHKKGAFTGAEQNKAGLVQLADKGTLFLDEIGELPILVQKHFLRVLQEQSYRPVGDNKELTSDFRLIAATNKDLDKMVATGEFRQDLLYRIKTVHLSLPSLAERGEDIKLLADYKIEQLCNQYDCPPKTVSPDFYQVLNNYSWPGNVRQLFNIVERAFIKSIDSSNIFTRYLPAKLRLSMAQSDLERQNNINGVLAEPRLDSERAKSLTGTTELSTLKKYKEESEKIYLQNLVARCGSDISACLKISGLSRSHFYLLLKKHDISISS